MKDVSGSFSNLTAQKWAGTVHDEFDYPVDSLALSPQGQPLSQMSFGEIYRAYTTGKKSRRYIEFLKEAVAKLENEKQQK